MPHHFDPLPDAEELKKWHMIFGMGHGHWGGADDTSLDFAFRLAVGAGGEAVFAAEQL